MQKGYHDVGEFYKDEEEFVWTDEMVKEFYNHWWPANQNFLMDRAITDFKASRSSTKATDDVRERITAFRSKLLNELWLPFKDNKKLGWSRNGYLTAPFTTDEIMSDPSYYEIYSALSKYNVEFKIGDIVSGDGIKNCMIEEFYIASLNHFVGHNNEDGDCIAAKLNTGVGVLIDHIEKSEEKKVLFTTLDDVKIYHDDKYWIVNSNSPYPRPEEAFADERMDDENLKNTYPSNKRFSTKEAAEQWIAHNQKSISFKELEDYVLNNVEGCDNQKRTFPLYSETSVVLLLAHFKPKESATKQ